MDSHSKLALNVGLAVSLILLCTCARRTILLENRFTEGEELRYRMTIRGEGKTSISGLPGQEEAAAETPVKLETQLTYRMVVKDVDARGDAEIETHFEKFTSVTESGGLSLRLEADEKGARIIHGDTVSTDAPGLEGLKELFRNPTTIIMNKRGRVLSIAEPKGAGTLLPHMDIPNLIREAQLILPEGPIAVGGSWKDKRDLMMPGRPPSELAGDEGLMLDTTYTVVRLVNRRNRSVAEIGVHGTVDAKNVETGLHQEEKAGTSVKTGFDRLNQATTGSAYFDPQRGCFIEMQLDTKQDAVMKITTVQTEREFTFTTTSTMKFTTDVNLIE